MINSWYIDYYFKTRKAYFVTIANQNKTDIFITKFLYKLYAVYIYTYVHDIYILKLNIFIKQISLKLHIKNWILFYFYISICTFFLTNNFNYRYNNNKKSLLFKASYINVIAIFS